MSIEVMKQALEALGTCEEYEWTTDEDYGMLKTYDEKKVHAAITALRTAIAEAEKQPTKLFGPGLEELLNRAGFSREEKQEPAPGYCKHCKQYTIEEPLPAVQRQWLGLEQSDMPDGEDPMYDHDFFLKGMAWADAILRKKNATPTEEQPPWVGLTDEDWKQLWTEFDSLPIESDFQDHMASKYGAGYYTDADMYWQFQQQVIRQMVNAKLKEKNNG